jgi:hypothetical protein
MEHRWGHRHDVIRSVYLRTRGGLARGVLRNVSVSGAFIESPLRAPVLTCVQIFVIDSDRVLARRRTIEGQVIRLTHDGFGIEWCQFASDAVCALYESIMRLQGAETDPFATTAGSRS